MLPVLCCTKQFIKDFTDQLLDQDQAGINAETKFRDLDDWDSLTAMAVIAMIEDKYGVKIETQDFAKLATIDELFTFITSRK